MRIFQKGSKITTVSSEKKKKRTRQQRRTSRTRQKLLDAGRAVFAEKGLDSTRIDEITERADVGKGTFYYHFQTKESLIEDLIGKMLGELENNILERCREIGDLNDLLDTVIQTHIDFFNNRWEDFVLFFQGRADLTLEESYEGIEAPFLEYLETIEDLLDSVIKYHLPRQTLRKMTCAVAGFVSGYYSFAFISAERGDLEQTFQSMRHALVASLARFIREAVPPDAIGKEEAYNKN
jgi:AcrR family transcriptional regulator